MDLGTQKHAPKPKPNNFTNCQSSSRPTPNSGKMNLGTDCLFWSSQTQFDPKKVFEELNKCFLDCDVNCNICTNFIFALTQHIRASHSKPETEIGGQSQNSETTGQGSPVTSYSNEAEMDELPRPVNTCGEKILIVDLEAEFAESPLELSLSNQNPTTVSEEEETNPNLPIPIPMDETVTEPQVPSDLQQQLIPCRFCQNKFLYSALKSHVESYHPEELVNLRIYRCRVCGLDTTFTTGVTARQHIYEAHPGEKPYFCKLCHTAVPNIISHVKHCPAKIYLRYSCVICARRFRGQGDLHRHVANSHPEESSKLVPNCEVCGRYFAQYWKLNKHKRESLLCSSSRRNDPEPEPEPETAIVKKEMKPPKRKPFECSTCEKRFYNCENLFRHLGRRHKELDNVEQEQLYFCRACDNLEFPNAKKLLSHRRKVHLNQEVEKCKGPEQSIPKIDKLNKRYTCQLCNKEYLNRIKYKRHLKNHGKREIPNEASVVLIDLID